MKKLGTPTTLGEFRKLTELYPDETLLQFRNEPVHELIEVDGDLCFNETNRWDKIGIIGGGFKGIICGIDEAKSIFISHKDMVRYPTLPVNDDWVHADDPEIYLKGLKESISEDEFRLAVLCIRPEVVEKFKNQSEQLKLKAKEASIAFERLGDNMIDPGFNENKKRKGHERPYKYHK